MRHVFIINPFSGVGMYKKAETWISNYFKDKEEEFIIRFTGYPGHAQEIASEYHGENTIVYSVGGDGTAHEVLNGLNLEVQLAIIPVGTGNDFWRMINYDAPLEEILKETISGVVKQIDVGVANGHRFLNCMNIGVDAEVNLDVNSVRKTWFPRKVIYMYYAVAELLKKKPIPVDITVDNRMYKKNILLTSIMNGKWYGNGFKSAPRADISDGLLDMCIVEDIPKRSVPKLMPKYYKGEHMDYDIVTYVQGKNITIKTEHPIAVGCDGEVFEYNEINIHVMEGAVKLRIPQDV